MTLLGIEYNSSASSFQEDPHQKLFFQGFFQSSASKMANCIIVDIVNYLVLVLANS